MYKRNIILLCISQAILFLRKPIIWVLHIIYWLLLNVLIGSIPVIFPLIIHQQSNPYLVGLLCFCFTSLGAGLYSVLESSLKRGQGGIAKEWHNFLLVVTVCWMLLLLIITIAMPHFIKIMDDFDIHINIWFYSIYSFSLLLFIINNIECISNSIHERIASDEHKEINCQFKIRYCIS